MVVRPCPQVRLRNLPANGSKRVRVRADDRKRRGKVHKRVQTPAQECSGRGPGRFRRRCGARGQRKSEKQGKPQDFAPNRRHRSRRRPASGRKRAPNGSKRLQTAPNGSKRDPSGSKRPQTTRKSAQTGPNTCQRMPWTRPMSFPRPLRHPGPVKVRKARGNTGFLHLPVGCLGSWGQGTQLPDYNARHSPLPWGGPQGSGDLGRGARSSKMQQMPRLWSG